jgi:hypothetical protein
LKRPGFWRVVAAAAFFTALATGIVGAETLPLPQGPPFGGPFYAPIALLLGGGLLAGAACFRSKWAQAHAWAAAIGLALFEFSFTLARFPASPAASLPMSLGFGAGGGLICFLLALPDLLAPRADSSR